MAVVNQNGISGISSFNAKGDGIQVFNSDGSAGSITGLSGVNVSGVITATTFTGDGSSLTGIASTDNIRTNTNATFLQNVNVLGAGITVGNTLIQSHSIGIGTTDTTGRNAGVTTSTGTLIYNTTTKAVEVFDGTGWIAGLQSFEATGGTKDTTSRSGYTVHTFTSPGTLVVQGPSITAEYLVIAGGGGGGGYGGGGGGAGGYLTGSDLSIQPGTYTIQIGGGGVFVAPPSTNSTQGTPSFINHPGITSITSTGGGRGGSYNAPYAPPSNGGPGGSGGGGGAKPTGGPGSPGGTGVSSPVRQGYDGGTAYHNPGVSLMGGGGGGASANGTNGTPTVGGAGGDGLSSSINGTATTRGGGGGGSNGPGGGGAGGAGGGGSMTPTSTAPEANGTDNTGGGGAARAGSGNGGSGIVIVAYQTP